MAYKPYTSKKSPPTGESPGGGIDASGAPLAEKPAAAKAGAYVPYSSAKVKHGPVPETVAGLLGAVGTVLSAPQQVAFKGVKAARQIAGGDAAAGFRTALDAAVEGPSLGFLGGKDIQFTEAVGAKKLPRGVETGAQVVLDPLNFLTLGTGSVAKKGLQTTAKVLGEEATERIAQVGLKKALTEAEQATLRQALVTEATEAGARNAERTAEKQIAELALRGRGGVTARVPFTKKGVTVLSGETAGKVGRVTGLARAAEAVKASPPAHALGRAFIPGRAVSEAVGRDASGAVLAAQSNRVAREGAEVADLGARIRSAVKDFEATEGRRWTEADDTFVHRTLESGDLAGGAAQRPDLARVLSTFDDIRRTTGSEQVAAGVLRDEALRDEATYLHRLLTPEATKALGKVEQETLRQGGAVSASLRQGAAQARVVAPDYAAHQINEAIAALHRGESVADEALGKAVKGIAQALPPGTALYRESAVASLIDRGIEAAKAISTARLMADMRGIVDDAGEAILLSADDVAAQVDQLVENGVPLAQARRAVVPEGWVSFELPKLGTFHAPAELKAEITKFMSVIGQDGSVGKFQEFLRNADRWWRTQVTASLPGGIPFAARNARSNLMLMWADGMPPSYLKRGRDLQKRAAKVIADNAAQVADEGVESTMRAHLTPQDFSLWSAAREHGVIGEGFYDVDLPTAVAAGRAAKKGGGRLTRAARFVASTEGTLATKGRALNQAVEQHARLSHFLYSVDRLGDVSAAAMRTKAVLFDYSALTPFEQRVIKRVAPFYTFARKNTPAQFRALVENPGRYVLPEKISRATTGPLPEDAPEYQLRQGSRLAKFGPFAGMVTTPERPLQAAVKALEPAAQLVAAAIPGKQGPLEPEKGAPQAFRSVLSNVGGIPGAFPGKYAVQEAGGVNLFTGYGLAHDEGLERLLAELYPALRRLPALTARLPMAEQRRKERQANKPLLAELAELVGIKVEPTLSGRKPN